MRVVLAAWVLLMAPEALAMERVVLFPVVATGARADWRSAGRMEGQLNERYGKNASVVTTTAASAAQPNLGRLVMSCRGKGSCLAGVLETMKQAAGLYVQIKGKGRRARLKVMTLGRAKVLKTWTGKWSGVDAAIESMMDELLATVAPEPEIAVKSESVDQAPAMELAVMDLANQGGFTDEQIALVQGNIMGLMQRSKRFKSIVGGADLRAMMDLEQQKSALGCDDASCLAELGGALGVPYLMTMSLGRFASQRVVNLSILYVDEAQVKHRVSRVFETDMLLLAKLPSLIEELLVGAYGAGGTALENDAFQLRVAQQAYERERRAGEARQVYQRPLVWVGMALMAGAGGFALMNPSDLELTTQRQRYDLAALSQVEREWDDFEGMVQRRELGNLMIPSLLSAGGGVLVWGLLSP